ncbi:MAG TPA: class I SAM-dependent methyltransferase [Chloroflexota bacterium]|nr:class I SAM-dependent methyltransferase [Chloroflexota bacterium]
MLDDELKAEAEAFDERIEERVQAGFIPDIRRAVKCEYFYKSFWRDPYYVKLFVGAKVDIFLGLLRKYAPAGARILDAGCGPGYITLELARAGYHVRGIDIAEGAIEAARRALAENPFKDDFGSLGYEVGAFEDEAGEYDVVLFSGALHHFPDPVEIVRKAASLLVKDGVIICAEPFHEQFRLEDAAQVALIRGLLSLTGHWYESPEELGQVTDVPSLEQYIREVHTEYVTERDKNEPGGQSPHDLSASGDAILAALRRYTDQLEYRDMFAFIYRLLGGLRGPDELTHRIADFVTWYERLAVDAGFLKANGFAYAGRLRPS